MFERYKDFFLKNFGIVPIFPKNTAEFNGSLIDTSDELANFKFRIEPMFKGVVLFKKLPFLSLLEINKNNVKNFVVLNEKSSFLFTCNRKLFSKGILKKKGKGPMFLVLNEKKEILGISYMSKAGFENKANIGYYMKQDNLNDVMF